MDRHPEHFMFKWNILKATFYILAKFLEAQLFRLDSLKCDYCRSKSKVYVTEGLSPIPSPNTWYLFQHQQFSDFQAPDGIWEFNSRLRLTPGVSSDPTSEGFSPTRLPSLQMADINEVSRLPTVLSSDYKFRGFHDSPSGMIISYNASQNSGKCFLTITAFLLLQRILKNSPVEEMGRAK